MSKQIIYHGSYCKVEELKILEGKGEPQNENDLFFTCSLIEYIARKTKNTKKYIIEKLEEKNIRKIYELAEVYHSENIEKVSEEFIEICNIEIGTYDVVENCKDTLPSYKG